jgi:hypothetical protein
MSRRFAPSIGRAHFPAAHEFAASDEWAWRPVGDVALGILKRAAVPSGTEFKREVR